MAESRIESLKKSLLTAQGYVEYLEEEIKKEEHLASDIANAGPCLCQAAPTGYKHMITLTVDANCPYHGHWFNIEV